MNQDGLSVLLVIIYRENLQGRELFIELGKLSLLVP